MSPTAVVVPEAYSYVLAALVSTSLLLAGQTHNVGNKRKLAGIKYPQLYAEKAEAESNKAAMVFNCAQRAHQNTLEQMPVVLVTTLVSGLEYPRLAASACGVYVVARTIYTIGYSSGDPSKRNAKGGILGSAVTAALLLGAIWTAVKLTVL